MADPVNTLTLDDEIGVALGVMGMSLDTFLQLTPYQFQKSYESHLNRTVKDREYEDNQMWQVARWQVWRTLCPPQQQQISVFDLINLPGDDQLKKPKTGDRNPAKDEKRFKALAEKWNG